MSPSGRRPPTATTRSSASAPWTRVSRAPGQGGGRREGRRPLAEAGPGPGLRTCEGVSEDPQGPRLLPARCCCKPPRAAAPAGPGEPRASSPGYRPRLREWPASLHSPAGNGRHRRSPPGLTVAEPRRGQPFPSGFEVPLTKEPRLAGPGAGL